VPNGASVDRVSSNRLPSRENSVIKLLHFFYCNGRGARYHVSVPAPQLTEIEARLVAILRGPKLSDRRVCEQLGITHEESIQLHRTLRDKLGVNLHREGLRDFVRRNKL